MITKEKIEAEHIKLRVHQNIMTEAEKKHAAAEAAYQDALADWEQDHPELVDARKDAKKALEKAQETFAHSRQNTKLLLRNYFQQPNADPKPAPGFGLRHDKQAKYDPATLVAAAIRAGATFLLKPDEKVIKNFISLAAQENGAWAMPDYIQQWLPELTVATVINPTISDKTFAQEKTAE
jgi:uncharacterized protein YukE